MNSPDRQPKCANAFSAQLRKSEGEDFFDDNGLAGSETLQQLQVVLQPASLRVEMHADEVEIGGDGLGNKA